MRKRRFRVRCPLCGRTRLTTRRVWCKRSHQHAEMRAVTVTNAVDRVLATTPNKPHVE